MARPSFQPTDEQRKLVEQFAAFGIPVEEMTNLVTDKNGKPIDEKTLRKHFKAELETGRVKANAKVAMTLYSKALSGDTTAMIFWLKTRARWKEGQSIELTGKDGGPIRTGPQPADLTDEELAAELAKYGIEP